MQTISTIAELDEKLAECDAAARVSDDALRRVFAGFRMDLPHDAPQSPFSEEYARYQMELYERLAGKPYRVENEATHFSIDDAVRRPFPYSTGSCATTGDQLCAIGALLRRMQLQPGARVLEFGPGWGNTTLALASLGLRVTAVDIESRFCELIRRRAELAGVEVDVVNADFLWAETITQPYDAVVFFECFHHATDHLRLLRALHRAVAPTGRIYFGGEPISPGFHAPWGLRLDGQSLWSIRKHGWFELGFRDDYFVQALAATGWNAVKHPPGDSPLAQIWEARQAVDLMRFAADDERLVAPAGTRDSGAIRLCDVSRQWGTFGPYAPLSPGYWSARVVLVPGAPRSGRGTFDVANRRGQHVLASRSIELESASNVLELDFALDRPSSDVEVRFFCQRNVTLSIDRIELVRDGARGLPPPQPDEPQQNKAAGNPTRGRRPLFEPVRLARRVAGRCYRAVTGPP